MKPRQHLYRILPQGFPSAPNDAGRRLEWERKVHLQLMLDLGFAGIKFYDLPKTEHDEISRRGMDCFDVEGNERNYYYA